MRTMKNRLKNLIVQVLLLFAAFLFLFPASLVLINSFKPLGRILGNTLGLPDSLYLKNFSYVLEKMNYARIFSNTLSITVVSIILIVIFSSMCAYKLSRTNDKKSWIILILLFSSMIIPFQTIMIPLAKVAKYLNLVDSIPGLIIIMLPLFSPFAVFMYHGFVKAVPVEMDEAAKIDGCSQLGTFFKIVFPMLTPTTASIVVLYALWIWNDFALPVIMLQSAKNKTITITIYTFFSSVSMRWDYALAALTLSALPVVIFFIFMQKYIIKGITYGSVKG